MKTISKINEKIYSLVSDIYFLDDATHDFNTREGKICANIRVSGWIDEDDVLKICEDKNLSKKQTKKVLKEFNEDRLNNVYNHVCEDGVRNLKEQYEGNCDLSDYNKIFKVWQYSNNKENNNKEYFLESEYYKNQKYYINQYFDAAKKFKTQKSWNAHIIKNNEIEFKEFSKRAQIDKFEVWQYGRSGGWLSICDEDEAQSNILEDNYSYYIYDELKDCYNDDNNQAFNNVLNDYLSRETKNDFIKNLETLLNQQNEKTEAIEQIIEDIEGQTKYFKENLLNELDYEIGEFVSTEFSVNKTNVKISIVEDKVKTSLGVTVDKEEFINAFTLALPKINKLERKEKLSIKKQVGNYFVEYAKKTKNDIIIKAGCHRFSFNNIIEVLNINPIAS
jgi:hypothetical protein